MDVDFSSLAIFILVLLSIVAVFAVLGNGFVLGIVARFKTFRTIPNILIANLALIDFFNALINIPIYLLWAVLNVEWFTGKAVAIISLLLSRLFIILNIVSMVVLLVNVFLAIALDLKYYTWKTNGKAVKIVLVEWVVCVIATALLSWFDSDIDLQDVSVVRYSRYRRSMLNKSQKVFAVIIAVFIFCAITFGVLVFCSIQRKKRQVRSQMSVFFFSFFNHQVFLCNPFNRMAGCLEFVRLEVFPSHDLSYVHGLIDHFRISIFPFLVYISSIYN